MSEDQDDYCKTCKSTGKVLDKKCPDCKGTGNANYKFWQIKTE